MSQGVRWSLWSIVNVEVDRMLPMMMAVTSKSLLLMVPLGFPVVTRCSWTVCGNEACHSVFCSLPSVVAVVHQPPIPLAEASVAPTYSRRVGTTV